MTFPPHMRTETTFLIVVTPENTLITPLPFSVKDARLVNFEATFLSVQLVTNVHWVLLVNPLMSNVLVVRLKERTATRNVLSAKHVRWVHTRYKETTTVNTNVLHANQDITKISPDKLRVCYVLLGNTVTTPKHFANLVMLGNTAMTKSVRNVKHPIPLWITVGLQHAHHAHVGKDPIQHALVASCHHGVLAKSVNI